MFLESGAEWKHQRYRAEPDYWDLAEQLKANLHIIYLKLQQVVIDSDKHRFSSAGRQEPPPIEIFLNLWKLSLQTGWKSEQRCRLTLMRDLVSTGRWMTVTTCHDAETTLLIMIK